MKSIYIMLAFVVLGCVQAPKVVEVKEVPKCVDKPLIVGHRGASGYVPEHTLKSYELAVTMGADFIEPDLVMTKDRVLIVRHENELSETTDVAEKFPDRKTAKVIDGQTKTGWFSEDFTLGEIKELRVNERLKSRSQEQNGIHEIVTLEEVLTWAALLEKNLGRRIGIIPELKHSLYFRERGLAMEEPLVALLKKYDRAKSETARVMIQSFEIDNLKRLSHLTELPLVQLIDDPELSPADRVGYSYRQMVEGAGLKEIRTYAQWISPHKSYLRGPNASGQLVDTGFVDRAHAVGLKVMPYTFRSDKSFLAETFKGDPAQEYVAYFKLGIDGLFTDFPDHALSAWRAFSETQDSLCKPTMSPAESTQ